MDNVKSFLTSRLALMVITSVASAAGTVLATEYPSIYSAVCVG